MLGSRLRGLRKRNGLTLEELAQRCSRLDPAQAPSVSYLSMLENGKRTPSPSVLTIIANVFGREPAWFLDASAALDALTDDERATFQRLNTDYVAKHGFPFIIAVRDHSKASILQAFHDRIGNDTETEFATACRQVERIAELRLKDILP